MDYTAFWEVQKTLPLEEQILNLMTMCRCGSWEDRTAFTMSKEYKAAVCNSELCRTVFDTKTMVQIEAKWRERFGANSA